MKILKTLFWPDIGENNRIDLFKTFPSIKSFFYTRKNFAYIRTLGDIIFLGLILLGLFGPQEPDRNIMLFLAWGVWWTSVVLSWFFLGRMWCAFCPFPGMIRLVHKLKLSLFKPPSKWLKDYGIHLATGLFFLIIWLESTTPLTKSPFYTAIFLISIVTLAGVFGMLYREQAWCRFLCPLGRITGVASTMALIEFRPDHKKCATCKGAPCRRGTDKIKPCPVYLGAVAVHNNLNCFICGHCLLLCPNDSPSIYLRHPFREVILNKGKGITCAYVIPFLIGSQFARFLAESEVFTAWANAIYFPPIVLFTILFFWFSLTLIVITKFSASAFKYFEDPLLGRFNLAIAILIPYGFTGELVYRLQYFLKNIGEFLPTLGRQFNIPSLINYYFQIPHSIIQLISILIITLSLFGSLYLIFYFYYRDFEREIPFKRYIHFLVLSTFIYISYVTFILIQSPEKV